MMMTVKEVREYLEGLPCAICTKNYSDEDLQHLIDDVFESTKQILDITEIDLNDEKTDECWFKELEDWAIRDYKMPYYEDL